MEALAVTTGSGSHKCDSQVTRESRRLESNAYPQGTLLPLNGI